MTMWWCILSKQRCYHRGSNWGSSTRGTALTRFVFIGCCDSGNNPDSNACRIYFDVSISEPPSKIEPGLVMWWSNNIHEDTHTYIINTLRFLYIREYYNAHTVQLYMRELPLYTQYPTPTHLLYALVLRAGVHFCYTHASHGINLNVLKYTPSPVIDYYWRCSFHV